MDNAPIVIDIDVLARARDGAWHAALESMSSIEGGRLWRHFADEQTGDWTLLLPRAAGRTFLLLGASNAQVCAVARVAERVLVPCARRSDAAFLRIQTKQLGLRNVSPVRGSIDCLADACCDVAAVLGPRYELGAIRRLVRSDGQLYLIGSNRWTGDGEGGTTFGRLRRRIRDAGFECQRSYTTVDGRFLTLDGPNPPPTPVRWRERLKRTRAFAPTWHIVAGQREVAPSWLEGLESHVRDALGLASSVDRFPLVQRSGAWHAGALMFVAESAIIRVALDPASEARIRRNFRALELCRDGAAEALGVTAPQPLLLDRFEGHSFSVESRLHGSHLNDLPEREWGHAESRIFECLRKRAAVALDGEDPATLWRRMVTEPLTRSSSWVRSEAEREQLENLIGWAAAYDPSGLPLRFTHGDFHPGNLILTADGGSGSSTGIAGFPRRSPPSTTTTTCAAGSGGVAAFPRISPSQTGLRSALRTNSSGAGPSSSTAIMIFLPIGPERRRCPIGRVSSRHASVLHSTSTAPGFGLRSIVSSRFSTAS